MQFSQVGEFASSKSAMKTLAPELSALITILRSTGPVISTRRSAISCGDRRDPPVPVADGRGLRQEVGELAGGEPGQALRPACEQLAAALPELPLEVGQEGNGVSREDVVDPHEGDLLPGVARGSSQSCSWSRSQASGHVQGAVSARVRIGARTCLTEVNVAVAAAKPTPSGVCPAEGGD